MRLGIVRLDGKGLFIVGNGFVLSAQFLEGIPQVIMRLSKVRLDGKGLFITGNGVFLLTQLIKDKS